MMRDRPVDAARAAGVHATPEPSAARFAPLVTLDSASVQLGRVRALADLSLDIRRGERVAVVGANGSGKSTLLRLLHGLAGPSAGQLRRHSRFRQAMVFQRPHMLRVSVQHNVALALWLMGTPWREAKPLALVALERVSLAGFAARNARTLSGGQQQRLALARAWALQPELLLLDEPTASLDPHAQREVEDLVAEFAAGPGGAAAAGGERGPLTLVFASHNLGQVKRLASRVIYLEQGRVLADLPVGDFFDRPLLRARYPAAHLFVTGESVCIS